MSGKQVLYLNKTLNCYDFYNKDTLMLDLTLQRWQNIFNKVASWFIGPGAACRVKLKKKPFDITFYVFTSVEGQGNDGNSLCDNKVAKLTGRRSNSALKIKK